MILQLLTCEGPKGKVTQSKYEFGRPALVTYSIVMRHEIAPQESKAGMNGISNCIVGAVLLGVEVGGGIAEARGLREEEEGLEVLDPGVARRHLEEGVGIPREGLALLEVLDAGVVEED